MTYDIIFNPLEEKTALENECFENACPIYALNKKEGILYTTRAIINVIPYSW